MSGSVDVQTARHYKAGTRRPGTLFSLNRDGAILPAEWQGIVGTRAMRTEPAPLDEIFYSSAKPVARPAPCAIERSESADGAEAKPSDLVRSVMPETVRWRRSARPIHLLPSPLAFGLLQMFIRSPSGAQARHIAHTRVRDWFACRALGSANRSKA